MKSVKYPLIPSRALGTGPSNYDPAGIYLNTFWNDFWFHIILPVRAELTPTVVR